MIGRNGLPCVVLTDILLVRGKMANVNVHAMKSYKHILSKNT